MYKSYIKKISLYKFSININLKPNYYGEKRNN